MTLTRGLDSDREPVVGIGHRAHQRARAPGPAPDPSPGSPPGSRPRRPVACLASRSPCLAASRWSRRIRSARLRRPCSSRPWQRRACRRRLRRWTPCRANLGAGGKQAHVGIGQIRDRAGHRDQHAAPIDEPLEVLRSRGAERALVALAVGQDHDVELFEVGAGEPCRPHRRHRQAETMLEHPARRAGGARVGRRVPRQRDRRPAQRDHAIAAQAQPSVDPGGPGRDHLGAGLARDRVDRSRRGPRDRSRAP